MSGIAYGSHSFYNRNNWHGPQPWQRWAKRVAKRREATPLKAWNARQLARVARLGGAQ